MATIPRRWRRCACWSSGWSRPAGGSWCSPPRATGGAGATPRTGGTPRGGLTRTSADAITRSWKQVIQFRPEAPPRVPERPRTSRPERAEVAVAQPTLEDRRREFVRDTRGVWLAREEAD